MSSPSFPSPGDPIRDLLARLGWPLDHADHKGSMQWQSPHTSPDALPVTANLTVTPRYIRATVLNMTPADHLEPHYLAEWDITSPVPELSRHVLAGENVPPATTPDTDTDQAVNAFTSLVLAFTRPPKVEIVGTRVKAKSAISSSPSLSSAPSR